MTGSSSALTADEWGRPVDGYYGSFGKFGDGRGARHSTALVTGA